MPINLAAPGFMEGFLGTQQMLQKMRGEDQRQAGEAQRQKFEAEKQPLDIERAKLENLQVEMLRQQTRAQIDNIREQIRSSQEMTAQAKMELLGRLKQMEAQAQYTTNLSDALVMKNMLDSFTSDFKLGQPLGTVRGVLGGQQPAAPGLERVPGATTPTPTPPSAAPVATPPSPVPAPSPAPAPTPPGLGDVAVAAAPTATGTRPVPGVPGVSAPAPVSAPVPNPEITVKPNAPLYEALEEEHYANIAALMQKTQDAKTATQKSKMEYQTDSILDLNNYPKLLADVKLAAGKFQVKEAEDLLWAYDQGKLGKRAAIAKLEDVISGLKLKQAQTKSLENDLAVRSLQYELEKAKDRLAGKADETGGTSAQKEMLLAASGAMSDFIKAKAGFQSIYDKTVNSDKSALPPELRNKIRAYVSGETDSPPSYDTSSLSPEAQGQYAIAIQAAKDYEGAITVLEEELRIPQILLEPWDGPNAIPEKVKNVVRKYFGQFRGITPSDENIQKARENVIMETDDSRLTPEQRKLKKTLLEAKRKKLADTIPSLSELRDKYGWQVPEPQDRLRPFSQPGVFPF